MRLLATEGGRGLNPTLQAELAVDERSTRHPEPQTPIPPVPPGACARALKPKPNP